MFSDIDNYNNKGEVYSPNPLTSKSAEGLVAQALMLRTNIQKIIFLTF